MIRALVSWAVPAISKPRASGDDPELGAQVPGVAR